MKFWLGVTDNRWFEFVSTRGLDEVNFWQPSARPPFTTLPEGTPFLFKLRRPHNHIAGGGFFIKYSALPLATAWNTFGRGNGAESLPDFASLISRNSVAPAGGNPTIGCSVLTSVFFLPRARWIPVGDVFPRSVMRGVTFDTAAANGAQLWAAVVDAMSMLDIAERPMVEAPRFGRAFLAHARLGQGAFRALVTDAYARRCAITGESTLPTLEAAHIQSYADRGPHAVNNGLLLRADFHKLFDLGLITVGEDYSVRVSRRIHDEWFNGKAYYRLDGQPLAVLPQVNDDRPNLEYLRWHNRRFAA